MLVSVLCLNRDFVSFWCLVRVLGGVLVSGQGVGWCVGVWPGCWCWYLLGVGTGILCLSGGGWNVVVGVCLVSGQGVGGVLVSAWCWNRDFGSFWWWAECWSWCRARVLGVVLVCAWCQARVYGGVLVSSWCWVKVFGGVLVSAWCRARVLAPGTERISCRSRVTLSKCTELYLAAEVTVRHRTMRHPRTLGLHWCCLPAMQSILSSATDIAKILIIVAGPGSHFTLIKYY